MNELKSLNSLAEEKIKQLENELLTCKLKLEEQGQESLEKVKSIADELES